MKKNYKFILRNSFENRKWVKYLYFVHKFNVVQKFNLEIQAKCSLILKRQLKKW